tara:strand:- start:9465 stop:11051 length:1587 start_codon:yes stop_codon:yes gene_type:complete
MLKFLSIAVIGASLAAQSPLTTTFASNNGQSGNMFDIVATNAAGITVKSFDVNIDAGSWDLEVWTLPSGTPYLPDVNNAAAWTMVGSVAGVVSNGLNVATPLPICVNTFVPAATTQAFYVTVTNGTSMNYTNGTTTGALYTSNADLEFYEGSGLAYPFNANFNPRIWNGNINYDIGDTTATSCAFASSASYGVGCSGSSNPAGEAQYELFTAFDLSNTGHTYIWTGVGYILTDGAGAIVAPTNTPTPFTDDNTQSVALGFTMPCSEGSVTDIALCSNGWLSFDSTVTSADLSESIAELLNNANSTLAFLWDDLNPASAGTINLEQVAPGEFHITFTDVPQFGNTDLNTVQIALFDTGVIEVRYGAVALLDCLVGVSPGFGAVDLGGLDYSDLLNLGPQIINTGVGPFTTAADLALVSSTLPKLNTNWDLTTSNIDPVSPIAITFLGNAGPAIPLTAIGLNAPGCDINLSAILGSITGAAAGGTATVSLALPANPALIGQQLSGQSIALTLANAANIITSNGVTGTVGN